MTELLRKAFEEASKLPGAQQDALASLMLAEMKGEKRWDDLFAQSEDVLERLADEALAACERGETVDFDPDKV